MNSRTVIQATCFATLMSIAGLASAVTVDFTGAGGFDYDTVLQSYGDSATADLSYQTLASGDNWGLSATQAVCAGCGTASYWADANYSGDQAIFASTPAGKLEVRLDAAPGLAFSSVGFQLGSFPDSNSADTEYRIYSGAGALLTSGIAAISGLSGLLINWTPSPEVSTIVFQLGDNWNRGVNSLSYETVTAVPLPGALLLMGSGLAGLLGMSARRRKELAR